MARSRKTWTTLLAEIRNILGETTAASSAWTDALLLVLWNSNTDLRLTQMADAQEDWLTRTYTLNLVANQAAYTIPVGTNNVKRVLRVITSGGVTTKTPLMRSAEWYDGEQSSGASVVSDGYFPQYRLRGGSIVFDVAPSFAQAGGIEVEYDDMPDPFTTGTDTLRIEFPDVLETLLVWDTAVSALRVEGSIGEATEGGYVNHILSMRDELAQQFQQVIQRRNQMPSFTRRYSLGA